MKLGQFLATRPDVVGPALARDLESLQDRMAPFPQAEAEAAVATALAKPLREIVHDVRPRGRRRLDRAGAPRRNRTQGPVAVKVLRPGIERRFKSDLDTLYFAARNAERHSAEDAAASASRWSTRWRARSRSRWTCGSRPPRIAEMRDNKEDDPDFRVPAVDWERTARGVLTLEWIDGTLKSTRRARGAAGSLPALGAR